MAKLENANIRQVRLTVDEREVEFLLTILESSKKLSKLDKGTAYELEHVLKAAKRMLVSNSEEQQNG